jgi:hypothetical protein
MISYGTADRGSNFRGFNAQKVVMKKESES